MADVTPDRIFQVASGFMAAKHLFVAHEVGLFEQLTRGPATLDELAQRVGIPRRTLRILADAMVALGFVEREGERYQNGLVAATFLSGRTPTDLRPVLRLFNHVTYPRWLKLEEAVRTGQPVFGELAFTPEEQRLFSEGVAAVQAAPAQALPTTYDFRRHRRVLDLGGGTGSWLATVLREYTDLQATLFELPAAVAIARPYLAGTPVAGRITIVEGDIFTDPIPDGHDVVLIANVLHLFRPERNMALLRRTRERVPGGSRLLLVDFWTDPTHTQPLFAALMAGEFLLAAGEGDVYSEEEGREWLKASGWQALERKPLAGVVSVIVAETAS